MKRIVLTLALIVTCCVPAAAQGITSNNDKTLWCASAFYWLAGSAEDAGASEEAETYDRWSKRLLEIASASLTSTGFEAERIQELITKYDEAALAQLGAEDAPYDVVSCPDLLGDWR